MVLCDFSLLHTSVDSKFNTTIIALLICHVSNSSYAIAGETLHSQGAEGATTPETLRQQDRTDATLWKVAMLYYEIGITHRRGKLNMIIQ